MTANPHLALVILAVREVSGMVDFYRRAFGWEQRVDTPVYAELAMPEGLRLGLYRQEGYARNTGHAPQLPAEGGIGHVELYYHADDLPDAIARLQAAGARPLSPLQARDWGDEAAYFADPEGNVIVLARPLGG